MNYSTIKSSTFFNSCYQIKSDLSEYECIGLYSKGLGLRIQLTKIFGIFKFLWCFAVFAAYHWYKFATILRKFKPLPFMNSRCAPIRLSYHIPAAVNAIWNWCKNQEMQESGEEKLKFKNKKDLTLIQQIFFVWTS